MAFTARTIRPSCSKVPEVKCADLVMEMVNIPHILCGLSSYKEQ